MSSTERDYKTGHDARTTIGNEMVRTLMWMNGGGALALLALVPQVWQEHEILIPFLLLGILLLAVGVLFTPLVNYARIDSSLAHESYSKATQAERDALKRRWRRLAMCSAVCFSVGCVVVAGGMLWTLYREGW